MREVFQVIRASACMMHDVKTYKIYPNLHHKYVYIVNANLSKVIAYIIHAKITDPLNSNYMRLFHFKTGKL